MFNIFVKAHKEEMASVIRGPARLGVGKCFDFLSGKKKNNSKFDPCQTLAFTRLPHRVCCNCFCKFAEEPEVSGHVGYPRAGETEQ